MKRGTNAVAPAPLILSKRMSVEQSFQIIAFNCLGQIEANAANMIEKYDVESLHQMRVGLRRLRSATNLFDTILTLPDFLHDEFNWLGTQLGAARDWDVFTTSTLPTLIGAYTGTPGDKKKLQQVMLAALDVAYEKHQTVLVTIRSKRYARLIAYGNTWVDGCEWRNGMPKKEKSRLARRIKKFARELIRRKQRRLRKRRRQWQESDQQTLHRLRIAVKKLRYAATFFSSLTTSKKMKPYLLELSTIQEELGRKNDREIANQLLTQLQAGDGQMAGNVHFTQTCLASMPGIGTKETRKLLKNSVQKRRFI